MGIVCLKRFKCFLYSTILFYPIKSEQKNFKKISMNVKIEHFKPDYDEYDSYVPNLILKISSYKSLNFKENLFAKFNQTDKPVTNLKKKILSNISISFKNNSKYQERERKFKLKNLLKNTFQKISIRLNKIKKVKKINKKKEVFMKIIGKFFNNTNRKLYNHFLISKKFSKM